MMKHEESKIQIPFKNFGLPAPILEYKFHPTRKWRIDMAFPDVKLAVETEGGCWTGGRHTSGAGFIKDMEKYNALTEMGWHLLRYQPNTRTIVKIDYEQIKRVYEGLKNELS
jgi:very-short-patch-repair endonuclease